MVAGHAYKFGTHDCFTFSVRYALGRLPVDIKYNNRATALQVLARHHVTSPIDLIDYYLKRTNRPVKGDIVCYHCEDFGGYGIWDGDRVITVDHNGKIDTVDNYLIAWESNGQGSR